MASRDDRLSDRRWRPSATAPEETITICLPWLRSRLMSSPRLSSQTRRIPSPLLSTSSEEPTFTVIRRAALSSAAGRAGASASSGMVAGLVTITAADNPKKWIPY